MPLFNKERPQVSTEEVIRTKAAALVDQLDQVAQSYHAMFDNRLPDPGRAVQFDAFLSTVKMAVSHSADESIKGA